jgi:hypothetical protein
MIITIAKGLGLRVTRGSRTLQRMTDVERVNYIVDLEMSAPRTDM